jgi:hypothetical protein
MKNGISYSETKKCRKLDEYMKEEEKEEEEE